MFDGLPLKRLATGEWPSRSFKVTDVAAIWLAIYDFLLVFHCKYICVLHRFRDINTYLPTRVSAAADRPARRTDSAHAKYTITKPNNTLRIFWYHMKVQSLCCSDINSGWWATPLPSKICAQWPTPPKNAEFERFPLTTSEPWYCLSI